MIFIGTSVSTARELDRLEPSITPLFQSTMNLIVMSLEWINLDITYCSTGECKHSSWDSTGRIESTRVFCRKAIGTTEKEFVHHVCYDWVLIWLRYISICTLNISVTKTCCHSLYSYEPWLDICTGTCKEGRWPSEYWHLYWWRLQNP